MATAAEYTFLRAVALAEQVRQTAKANAFNTWAYGVGSAYTTYVAALVSADNTYFAAVTSAMNTSGLVLGNVGSTGPLGSQVATITSPI